MIKRLGGEIKHYIVSLDIHRERILMRPLATKVHPSFLENQSLLKKSPMPACDPQFGPKTSILSF